MLIVIRSWAIITASALVVALINAPVVNAQFVAPAPVVHIQILPGEGAQVRFINERGLAIGTSGSGRAVTWQDGMMTELEGNGSATSDALVVNDRGQIAGWAKFPDEVSTSAFRWQSDGSGEKLETLQYSSTPRAINNRGVIAGYSVLFSDTTGFTTSHATIWRATGIIDLGVFPGYTDSQARDINDAGTVVGESRGENQGEIKALKWRNGKMTVLPTPGDAPGAATAINRRGQILGLIYPANQFGAATVIWDGTRTVNIGSLGGDFTAGRALNDRGTVVGSAELQVDGNSFIRGFMYRKGKIVELGSLGESASYSNAIDVNNRDQAVGVSSSGPNNQYSRAVLWQDGVTIDLGTLGGTASDAYDINDHGQVVGSATDAAGIWHAVMWTIDPCPHRTHWAGP